MDPAISRTVAIRRRGEKTMILRLAAPHKEISGAI
jgi:hypothetical protein